MTKCILLLGGCGYVGVNLTRRLKGLGYDVCIADITNLPHELVKLARYIKVDVTNPVKLFEAMNNVNPIAVIHLASWGMSGAPMLNPKARSINIKGAEATIAACKKSNVSVLLYTSTYNVVFGGKEIVKGDESTTYFPVEKHTDMYSGSKAIAEQNVLQANGSLTSSGKPMITSVIRPAAIYGENELRHFPRILKHMDSGIFAFRIGSATVDWVHVENLVRFT